jgi:hypothetical protein
MNAHRSSKCNHKTRQQRQILAHGKKAAPAITQEGCPFAPETRDAFRPARELLIALSWYRLFRTIVSPSYALASQKRFSV